MPGGEEVGVIKHQRRIAEHIIDIAHDRASPHILACDSAVCSAADARRIQRVLLALQVDVVQHRPIGVHIKSERLRSTLLIVVVQILQCVRRRTVGARASITGRYLCCRCRRIGVVRVLDRQVLRIEVARRIRCRDSLRSHESALAHVERSRAFVAAFAYRSESKSRGKTAAAESAILSAENDARCIASEAAKLDPWIADSVLPCVGSRSQIDGATGCGQRLQSGRQACVVRSSR